MRLTHFGAWLTSFAVITLGAGAACGQGYPDKPIRMVASPPGGSSDFIVRVIAQGIPGSLGQPMIVDNRPGIIPIETVAGAAPDGYTLLIFGGALWLSPLMREHASWNPLRDFSPITLVGNSPNVIVVNTTLPAKSVKELIALARARPGEINYSSGATGGSAHLATELFKAMAGVNIVRIPFKGTGPALNAVLGGEVHLTFGSAGTVAPHVKSGKLRALAVTSAEPSMVFAGLPTVAASGLPGYESTSLYGIFAPAKTSAAIIGRLNHGLVQILDKADTRERFLGVGIEAVSSSPAQLAARIKAEMARLGKVIKDAGIREE